MSYPRKDVCGEEYNGITVVGDAGMSKPFGKRGLRERMVHVKCKCSKVFKTYLRHVRCGMTKSCGCLRLSLIGIHRKRSAESVSETLSKSVVLNGSPCMPWPGDTDRGGYGLLPITEGGRSFRRQAHRMVYENVHGKIPDGLVLDHLCKNKLCVNPSHLEVVTRGENASREFDRRTHCKNGHSVSEYGEEDTVYNKASNRVYRRRVCRKCISNAIAKRTAKRKAMREASRG